MIDAKEQALKTERRGEVAILWMDVPGKAVNTLSSDFSPQFAEVFDSLEHDTGVRAIVFASAKKTGFIVGADLEMIHAARTEAGAATLSRDGQVAMDRLEAFPKPVVAAIDGPCLGGGLELALACAARVASDSKATKLGLPEVQLGLLPGAGGTQRLPRLIGVQAALDMMLTGRQLNAKKAKKVGLVDEIVPAAILIDVALEHARKLAARVPEHRAGFLDKLTDKHALTEMALTKNPVGRKVLFDQARSQLLAKSRGNYPSPEAILRVVRIGLEKGMKAGLAAESEEFGRLVMSPEAAQLMGIFFATTAMKKDSGVDDPKVKARPIHKVGVLGGGLMGAGVAFVTATRAKMHVRLEDKDDAGVLHGLGHVRAELDKGVKRKRLTRQDADRLMLDVTGTTDYSGLKNAEVVIEAVFEDLELKRRMVRDVEAAAGPEVIFASNTSSLPITAIAEASAHPETVIGMHYFSPVEKMPLLEIITTDKTADWVTATCVALGKKQGKTVIVVRDGVGFYTTRILAPLMNEAAYLLSEGVPIERIDGSMVDFGFPVGPIKLTDEVGIDVGAKVGKVLVAAFGDRLSPPNGMERLVADGRSGRKNGRGFYRYDGEKGVDKSVYGVLGVKPTNTSVSDHEIAWRCTLAMVNEACRCLGEGILRSPRDGDIGAIFGLGFPPFRGGPFRLADSVGPAEILNRLEAYEERFGARFSPAPMLRKLAESDGKFHREPSQGR